MDATDSTTNATDPKPNGERDTPGREPKPGQHERDPKPGGTATRAGPAATLADLRADPRQRRLAAAVGAVVGLAVAQVHWLGFLVGGALVGLAAPDLRRALAYGLAFGLLGVALFATLLLQAGSLESYAATGQLFYVGLAVPVVGGLVGSLLRGVV